MARPPRRRAARRPQAWTSGQLLLGCLDLGMQSPSACSGVKQPERGWATLLIAQDRRKDQMPESRVTTKSSERSCKINKTNVS